jgi:hypothetical protein
MSYQQGPNISAIRFLDITGQLSKYCFALHHMFKDKIATIFTDRQLDRVELTNPNIFSQLKPAVQSHYTIPRLTLFAPLWSLPCLLTALPPTFMPHSRFKRSRPKCVQLELLHYVAPSSPPRELLIHELLNTTISLQNASPTVTGAFIDPCGCWNSHCGFILGFRRCYYFRKLKKCCRRF